MNASARRGRGRSELVEVEVVTEAGITVAGEEVTAAFGVVVDEVPRSKRDVGAGLSM